jgi:predicted DNA-binding protein
VAGQGHPILFRARPEFVRVVDALAERRGLTRSAYLRQIVKEDALRFADSSRRGGPDAV